MNSWLKLTTLNIFYVINGHWHVINRDLLCTVHVKRVDYDSCGEYAAFISLQWKRLFILGDNYV